MPSRARAILALEADRAGILAALERVPRRELSKPGIGGGDWSPTDLMGHLESWEEHAVGALEAWAEGETAPISRRLRTEGLNRVNLDEVARKAGRSPARAISSAAATHSRLIAAIDALTDEVWRAPATRRSRRPLGLQLGGILGGPAGAFRHDAAHLKDLLAFAELHGS